MEWFHDPGYDYGHGLPGRAIAVHGFVLDKPTRIHDWLVREGVATPDAFRSAVPVSRADLVLVHTRSVIEALGDPAAVAAAIELGMIATLPAAVVEQAVVAPQLLAAGGTCAALRAAAGGAWAINLSGGFHHARPDRSHGFCLVNDVAIAVAKLRIDGIRPRILIVDLDLHQGDGNALCFAGDDHVFTVSLHQQNLFPQPKTRSDVDVGLWPGTTDAEYLARLEHALVEAAVRFPPDVLVYLAGSDPFHADPLGELALSESGLLARDRRVADFARELGCALVALPAGGYSPASATITARGFAAIAARAVDAA